MVKHRPRSIVRIEPSSATLRTKILRIAELELLALSCQLLAFKKAAEARDFLAEGWSLDTKSFRPTVQVCLVVSATRKICRSRKGHMMAKRAHASRREKLVRRNGEDILRHSKDPEAIARLKRLAEMPDSQIDFSDIPEVTAEQLARMGAVARLPRGAPQKNTCHSACR